MFVAVAQYVIVRACTSFRPAVVTSEAAKLLEMAATAANRDRANIMCLGDAKIVCDARDETPGMAQF